MKTLQIADEIRISDSSDWSLFDEIAKNLQQDLSAKCIEICDGLDQAYHDFDLGGTIVTLHLEYYLGISLFLKSPKEATKADLLNFAKVRSYFENHQAESGARANRR